MATKFLNSLDLTKNQLRNAVVGHSAGTPTDPVRGQIYFDTNDNKIKVRGNSTWGTLEPDPLTALSVSGPLQSTGGQAPTISIPAASNAEDGYMSSSSYSLLMSATPTNVADSLVQRSASGQIAIGALVATSASLSSTLSVSGNSTLAGRLTVTGSGVSVGSHASALNTNGVNVEGGISSDQGVYAPLITAATTLWAQGNLSVDGSAGFTGAVDFNDEVDMNDNKIVMLADPIDAQDAVNKRYVDALVQGLDVKASVRVATVGAISISNPPASIDGVSLSSGDRVLVKDQIDASENGIYVFTAGGSSGGNTLVRAADFNSSDKVSSGAFTFVEEGDVNADTGYVLTTNDPIVLDADNLTFSKFSSVGDLEAGNGLTRTLNTFDVGAGLGIIVDDDTVAIDTAVVARKYAATIGNGSDLSYTVTHGLGTRDVQVTVYTNDSVYETVIVDVERTSTNAVTINFSTAPASGAYRVVVIG